MATIEGEVRPDLEPMMMGKVKAVTLSPESQVRLAKWAMLKALIMDSALPGNRVIPRATFREFHRHQLPPDPGVLIWTTAYAGPKKAAHAYRWSLTREGIRVHPFRPRDVPERLEMRIWVATFSVFRAIFQVLGYVGGEWLPPFREASPNVAKTLIRLWPSSNSVDIWPRGALALSDRSLDLFAKRTDFLG